MVAGVNDSFSAALDVDIVDAAVGYTSPLVEQKYATTETTGFVHTLDPNVQSSPTTASEPGESGSQQRSLWWRYQPLVSGNVTISTQSSPRDASNNNDTQTVLWKRRPGYYDSAITKVAGFADGGTGYTSVGTDIPVVAGETYYIQVGHWNNQEDGSGRPGVVLTVSGPITRYPPDVVIESTSQTTNSATVDWSYDDPYSGFDLLVDGSEPGIDVGNVLSYTLEGLLPSTEYTLTIRPYRATPGFQAFVVDEAVAVSNYPGEEPSKAFDGNANTWWSPNGGTTGWLRAKLGASETVARYSIRRRDDYGNANPKDWTIEGSPDGAAWTTLDTRTGITWPANGETKTFTMQTTGAYRYYRINVTANNGQGWMSIAEWKLEREVYSRESVNSAETTVSVTTDPDLPGPPRDLVLTPSFDYIAASWLSPLSANHSGYLIRVDDGPQVDIGDINSYSIPDLSPGVTYTIELTAYSSGGNGPSIVETVTTPVPIDAIAWDDPNERYYVTGLDRGVLYPKTGLPVPWNGLTGLDEVGNGTKTVLYRDGRIFYADVEPGDYEGSLTAFFYPDEFAECAGIPQAAEGLFVDNQRPKRFGLAYRNLIGSGNTGDIFGYQIHLVYNAVAVIGTRSRKTMTNTPELGEFAFDLTATPIKLPGMRPSAHYIIDTRFLDPTTLEQLEKILYGDGVVAARLPLPQELFDMIKFGSAITFVDHGDGTWTASGSSSNIIDNGDGTIRIKNVDGVVNSPGVYTLSDTP